MSNCSENEIEAIRLALKYKSDLSLLGSLDNSISIAQELSFGSVWLIYRTAVRLGIVATLGNSREGKLTFWQVIARIIDQGSRLSAVRLAGSHAACDILDMDAFNEDDLYRNLDWIDKNQESIEDGLYRRTNGGKKKELFLYDVTSSYLEGTKNELAAFGYNRDKKKGKKQIVIGLICDCLGNAISVEVFKGNTVDTATFGNQIEKIVKRFGGDSITFVGDKGMIKEPQIEAPKASENERLHYITSITKPQIEKLLKDNKIQIGMFDEILTEIKIDNEVRYILRRNPIRALEMKITRQEKLKALQIKVDKRNVYLAEHARAKTKTAQQNIEIRSKKLKLDGWVQIAIEERKLSLSVDQDELDEISKLDGCYVLKTDLTEEMSSKETVHNRYKDLALVEWAFRTQKTMHLEMRPINVRLEERTRGHVFVTTLAYRIIKKLKSCWDTLDMTVEEGIKELNSLCVTKVETKDGGAFNAVPEPRDSVRKLFDCAEVVIPKIIQNKGVRISTRKKLTSRRKSHLNR